MDGVKVALASRGMTLGCSTIRKNGYEWRALVICRLSFTWRFFMVPVSSGGSAVVVLYYLLFVYILFSSECVPCYFVIFFLFGFPSIKAAIFLWRFVFLILRGILGALWQHCFPVYCPFPAEGSSILNSYGDGFRKGCSAGVQRSLIVWGSKCAFSFNFVFNSIFSNFIMCKITY